MTREMFCLMEGRHVHPSTLYPGGVGTVPTVQLFTDYIVRLMKYVEFMKKVVPLHDDLFDFFYETLPGYEEVGRRRILLGCWGSFNNPDVCDYTYAKMTDWGRGMYVTPGVVVDGKLVTTDLVDINLNIRILLGSSYYDDWQMTDGQWESLLVPINMAFLFRSSIEDRTIALYPSPAGVVESLLPLEAWDEIAKEKSHVAQVTTGYRGSAGEPRWSCARNGSSGVLHCSDWMSATNLWG